MVRSSYHAGHLDVELYALSVSGNLTRSQESQSVIAAKTGAVDAAIGSPPHREKKYASFVGMGSGDSGATITSTLPQQRRCALIANVETSSRL